MFFLFGWGHRTTKDRGPTLPTRCGRCHNDTWLHLVSYRTWFTLFFVPVLPYESKSLLLCPICSNGMVLSEHAADEYENINDAAAAFRAGQIQESEFLAIAEGSDLPVDPSGDSIGPSREIPQRAEMVGKSSASKRLTQYAAANVCLVCQKGISRSAAKIEVSFIHERGKCVGNIHAACAQAFKKAAATNETSALYERNFLER